MQLANICQIVDEIDAAYRMCHGDTINKSEFEQE